MDIGRSVPGNTRSFGKGIPSYYLLPMDLEETKQFRLHWTNTDKSNKITPIKKEAKTMGLGYFFIFTIILGAAGIAVALLIAAWGIWKKARFKILAIIPLLLGSFCAFIAFYLLGIILREGFYHPF